MQTLALDHTDETPGILLDKKNGIFEISGRSLPEDSAEFFDPVLNWLKEYAKQPNETTKFVFKMEYSNTASSKFIHEILMALQKIKGVKVVWSYHEDDEDMEEAGQEFSEQIDIPFEFETFH
jgi:hypothetical protein